MQIEFKFVFTVTVKETKNKKSPAPREAVQSNNAKAVTVNIAQTK